MGMSIDEARYLIEHHKPNDVNNAYELGEAFCVAIDTMRKYQMMQADYKARLKADMVATLEELKEELREMHEDFFETEHFDEAYGVSDSMDVIQQKINALKENSHDD